MYKDYFNPNLSSEVQQYIHEVLDFVPLHRVFSSYNQAIRYRAANSCKRENGRYDDAVFCYDGFFYVVSSDRFHSFKLFLKYVARYGAKIPLNHDFCLNFKK